jgi:hypothetical protein
MAADIMMLSNAEAIATDSQSHSEGNVTLTAHRQLVVSTPPADPGVLAIPAGQRLAGQLASTAPSTSLVVDGSTTPVVYEYAVPADFAAYVDHLVLVLVDDAALAGDGFGALAALTNGLVVTVLTATTGGELLETHPAIKRHADVAELGGSVELLPGNAIAMRLPLQLKLAELAVVRVTVSDNLTGLVALRARAVGRIYEPSSDGSG